jgi:hypothetical protein
LVAGRGAGAHCAVPGTGANPWAALPTALVREDVLPSVPSDPWQPE